VLKDAVLICLSIGGLYSAPPGDRGGLALILALALVLVLENNCDRC
jgi:hypothetical protein